MFAPILAAIGLDDVIRIVIVVVFFLAPIISQINKSAKKEPKGRNRPRRPPRPGEPRQPEPMAHVPQQQRPPRADLQDSVQAEIDEFVRRKADAPPAEAAPKRQPRFEILRSDVDAEPAPPKPPMTVSEQSTPKPIEREPLRRESVAEHVRLHLDTDEFSRRSEHMADQLEHADEKLEAHLKDVFQHSIGRLSEQSTPSGGPLEQGTDANVWESTTEKAQHKKDAAVKRASDLISMLRDPVNVRASIVISEIMRRPDFDEFDRKSKR